jgi:hypothetical protein
MLVALACGLAQHVAAQEEPIHWAYAALYGTGHYSIDGRTDTTVFSMAPGWTRREASLAESGERSIGYRFRFPVAIGAHDFSGLSAFDARDALDELSFDNVSTISVMPGVDVEIPISRRWSLKALGFAGYGTVTGSAEHATIFRLGVRSRLGFDLGASRLALVNGVGRFGYNPSIGPSSAINLITSGIDVTRPLQNLRIGGEPAAINWHLLYTRYTDTLGLSLVTRQLDTVTVDEEWELGFSFSKQTGRLAMKRIKFDRVGLAYRFSGDGTLTGVGIVVKSLFDR